jgi:predicted TIM-barrel fold metal-dependent hydrolase
MDIVDAQVHVFQKHTEAQTMAAMDALGIKGVVIDEVWSLGADETISPCQIFPNGATRPLTPLAQAAALKFPDRFSLLQRVSRDDPELAALFAVLSATPGCRAVRIDAREKTEQQALSGGGYNELLRLARRHELPVFLLMVGPGVADTARGIAVRFSDIQFILDHCGRPASLQQWDEILTLSECPNLAMKWCHPHHYFDAGPYPFAGLRVQLARAIGSFGARRIMWASDITVDRAGVPWADLLYTIRDDPSLDMSDKEWVLGRTARTLLKWNMPVPGEASPRT